MLGSALRALDRAIFNPAILPPSVVTAIAVLPPVLAGLVFFKVAAAAALVLALAIGAALHLAARRLGQPAGESPALAAVFAVALLGPAAPTGWVAGIALGAGLLELARARFLPGFRAEMGLLAYAVALAAGGGVAERFVQPGTGHALAEPIRLWAAFGGGGAAPIDPVRLYVGNVPGPLFATSLMAVAVGAAWLWYARRLSLVVLVAFAAGAALPALALGWKLGYHLDSGPAWFVVALVLADRRRLPTARAVRPLLGLAAGLVAVAPRARGYGIETAVLGVAALQALVGAVEGLGWLVRNRGWVLSRIRSAGHQAQGRFAARGRAI